MKQSERPIELGLRQNAPQFILLVVVNMLVGGMVGQQQTVLPLLAEHEFRLTGYTFMFTYVAAFGITKAVANYAAGSWADTYGRRPVLLAGCLVAVPVPLMLIWAPSWGWVIAANVLLGVNQGLAWSTTVIMKIDLVGPHQRGLAMGLNEAAGYGAMAVTAMAAGYLAQEYGLRPAPFLLGLFYVVLAILLITVVRETRDHARLEAAQASETNIGLAATSVSTLPADLDSRQIIAAATYREPALSSASQAGLVNNLNFGLSWGLFPLLFAAAGTSTGRIGFLMALYPGVWGLAQLLTGAASDRWGRKHLISVGMLLQALALGVIATATGFDGWVVGTVILGTGTAMVYPTLLAVVGDVAHPDWRGRAVGVYRVWRDLGYAAGAVIAGVVADLWDLRAAVWVAAAISLVSAIGVMVRMYETRPRVSLRR